MIILYQISVLIMALVIFQMKVTASNFYFRMLLKVLCTIVPLFVMIITIANICGFKSIHH